MHNDLKADLAAPPLAAVGTIHALVSIYAPETDVDAQGLPRAHWWWLSYADAQGCRGVCIVQGVTFMAAVLRAATLGISPHGDVRGEDLGPDRHTDWPDPAVRNRCLSAEEVRERGMVET